MMFTISVRNILVFLSLLLTCGPRVTVSTRAVDDTSSETPFQDDRVPSWEELDARPLPKWYDDAKFGIFIHWGLFSVPSFGSEWFLYYWKNNYTDYSEFIRRTERPNFSYADYAERFTADLYKPKEWVKLFVESGAQYVVLTSKHHDGFCNWNTSKSVPTAYQWNSLDVGPRRDLVGELATALQNVTSPYTSKPLQLGLYHSLLEWFNPLYLRDRENNYQTNDFVRMKIQLELVDLVQRYHPVLLWSDGHWMDHSDYWQSRQFLHWYAYQSPVASQGVVWNDRWGNDTQCRHGTYWNCEDKYDPKTQVFHKWENALSIDTVSWGYNRNTTYEQYLTTRELIHTLGRVVALGGNLLLNIGPAADGTIHPIFADRLLGIGRWLQVNGDAIYATQPWKYTNETGVANANPTIYYSTKNQSVYCIFQKWPANSLLELEHPIPTARTAVRFLGLQSDPNNRLPFQPLDTPAAGSGGIAVTLPQLTPNLLPSQHACVLELTHLANANTNNEEVTRSF